MTNRDPVDRGVCVITGGSRGIGAATVRRAVAEGWTVCFSWVNDRDAAASLASELGARAVRADVSSASAVGSLFEAARELGPITAAVANAGIVGEKSRVDEMSPERLRRMLEVNALGVMLTGREAVRSMSRRHGGAGGSIVAVSSIASRLGSPGEYVDYAASKAAVDTFVLGLAKEVAAEGLRVNAVRPGIIDTEIHASGGQPDRATRLAPQIPMGRAGRADEVAAAIVWLLGPESSYTTGTTIDVGGGR